MKNSKHFVTAKEANGGWIGIFGAPGKETEIVKDQSGNPEIFPNKVMAIASAGACLCSRLNGSNARQVFFTKTRERTSAQTTAAQSEKDRVFSAFK